MRAAQVVTLTGPTDVVVQEVPDATAGEGQVLVEVHAVGTSFPDLLLSRGEYQMKPEPPFTLGVDVAGVVVSGEGFEPGQRVCAVQGYGGASELAAMPVDSTFALPDALSFEEGAAMPMNYLTAQFALAERAGLREGETVLVHGAAGGVGTATIQVAKGYGARSVAVVSTEEKAEVARQAGADEVVLLDGWKDAVKELTGGKGVDVVDGRRRRRRVPRLPALAGPPGPAARRRLRRRAGHPRGQGQPAAAQQHRRPRRRLGRLRDGPPGLHAAAVGRAGADDRGRVVKPPVGRTYAFEEFGQALVDLDERRTLGKGVVRLRD